MADKEDEEAILHEETVCDLAETKVFVRGIDLFADGTALLGLQHQGNSLRGWCLGSSGQPYVLRATVQEGAVVGTSCTCPYSYEGICKHLVALLLAWCHTPETFTDIPPMQQLLEGYTPGKLAEILAHAVDRDPGLLAALAPEHYTAPDFGEWDGEVY